MWRLLVFQEKQLPLNMCVIGSLILLAVITIGPRLSRPAINTCLYFRLGKIYYGATLKYGKEINVTIATPLWVAFIYFHNQATFES